MAKPERGGWIAPTAYLMGAGWYFATCIVVGIVLGLWLDDLTGLEPLFILLGIVLARTLASGGGIRMLLPFMKRFGGGANGANGGSE